MCILNIYIQSYIHIYIIIHVYTGSSIAMFDYQRVLGGKQGSLVTFKPQDHLFDMFLISKSTFDGERSIKTAFLVWGP